MAGVPSCVAGSALTVEFSQYSFKSKTSFLALNLRLKVLFSVRSVLQGFWGFKLLAFPHNAQQYGLSRSPKVDSEDCIVWDLPTVLVLGSFLQIIVGSKGGGRSKRDCIYFSLTKQVPPESLLLIFHSCAVPTCKIHLKRNIPFKWILQVGTAWEWNLRGTCTPVPYGTWCQISFKGNKPPKHNQFMNQRRYKLDHGLSDFM